MAITRTKPAAVKRSKTVDQSVSKFVLFCGKDERIANDIDFTAMQALVTAGTIQVLEVYGLTPSNAENGTIEIGGISFQTTKGEKRYTGDVMTEYLSALPDYSYYSSKGAFLVTLDDNIRGIPDGETIAPYPLNNVVGGDKEAANDGSTASTPKIMFNIDGKQALLADEWCLNDFVFDNIVVPTV